MYDLCRIGGDPWLHCTLRVGSESLDDLGVNQGHKRVPSDRVMSLAYLFGHFRGDEGW